MIESGWNSLKDVILDSKFCKYTFNATDEVLIDAFATMGRCYIYECLALKTDKFTHINVTVKEDCEFEVIVCKDSSEDYKKYLGRWQDWEFDDEGNFLSSHVNDEGYDDDAKQDDEVNSDDE